jgi:hypothetical protein
MRIPILALKALADIKNDAMDSNNA